MVTPIKSQRSGTTPSAFQSQIIESEDVDAAIRGVRAAALDASTRVRASANTMSAPIPGIVQSGPIHPQPCPKSETSADLAERRDPIPEQ